MLFTRLLFPALLLAHAAGGQTNNTAATLPRDTALAPVEVRAVRASTRAPYARTEVDSAAIQKQNLGQDLPYILQYTPGAVVTSDAGAGVGYTGIRIRGTDGSRINVTLNGVPVNDAESGATFFVDLPDLASNTSSIQVQRGAGSATNGGAAFGASLSIANLATNLSPAAEVALGAGSFNTRRVTLKGSTGLLSDRFAMDVRLSRISSDGYIDRSGSTLMAAQITALYRVSDRTRLRALYLNGHERTGQAWGGVAQANLDSARTFNELGMRADGTFYPNQSDNYGQQYYQLFADHQFSSRTEGTIGLFLTRGKGFYEEYRLGESLSAYGLQPFVLPGADTLFDTDMARQLWLDNHQYGLTGSLIHRAAKGTTITIGGALSRYDGLHYGDVIWAAHGVPDHHRWYRLSSQKTDANLYAKLEQRLGSRLWLYAEAQGRAVDYNMGGFRKNPALMVDASYFFFNPRLGLTWDAWRMNNRVLRLSGSVARVGKEPVRDDFETAAATQPKAERLLNPEVAVAWQSPGFSATLNGYYMHYRDQLTLTGRVNDVGAYNRVNVPESYRAGVELSAAARPAPWLALEGNVAISQNKIKAFTEFFDDYDAGGQAAMEHRNTDLAFSPRVVAAVGATILPLLQTRAGKGLELTVMGKHVGRQFLDNTQSPDRAIAAYTLLDARIRYGFALRGGGHVALNLALNNLTNRRYENNGYAYRYRSAGEVTNVRYYFPQAGFNWLAGVTVGLR